VLDHIKTLGVKTSGLKAS